MIVFTLTSGVIISIALVLISYLSFNNQRISNRILKTEISNLSPVNEIYNEHKMVSERLNQMEAIYDITVSNNEHFVGLLEDIEDKIPTRAIVDSINASAEGLSLSLVADSEVTVAKTLQRNLNPYSTYKCLHIFLSISEDEFGLKRVTFVIDARYNPEGFEANVGSVD